MGGGINKVRTNSAKAWWLAARPKTLTGAIAPVLVGGMMAMRAQCGGIESFMNQPVYMQLLFAIPFILCVLFAVLMQIDANFINDYFDWKRGTDREDRLGPERACAQGWITPRAMVAGIVLTTLLSCLVGVVILLWRMQFELLWVGVACVVFCFLYTLKLSYIGMGDLLVVVFFGLVPVGFTYYVITGGGWTSSLTLAALAMGIVTDNLLIVNNFRDRYQDSLSGKRTIFVSMLKHYGTERTEAFARILYISMGVVGMVFAVVSLVMQDVRWYYLMLFYLFMHLRISARMFRIDGRQLNSVLGATALNIFLFGIIYSLICAF